MDNPRGVRRLGHWMPPPTDEKMPGWQVVLVLAAGSIFSWGLLIGAGAGIWAALGL